MRRRTFDALATAAGLLLVVVLVVAGVLLSWGHSYANDNQVASQLSAQKISVPDYKQPGIQDPASGQPRADGQVRLPAP